MMLDSQVYKVPETLLGLLADYYDSTDNVIVLKYWAACIDEED